MRVMYLNKSHGYDTGSLDSCIKPNCVLTFCIEKIKDVINQQ